MKIESFKIIRKKKKWRDALDKNYHSIKYFDLQKEADIPAMSLINDPNILPYTIDFKRKKVYFTDITSAVKLSNAAFVTDEMYHQAQKLYAAPFWLFNFLSKQISCLNTELSIIGHTPRSGTTLLCRALSRCDEIMMMSEPIILNEIERFDLISKPYIQELMKSLVLFISNFSALNGKKMLCFKPFSISSQNILDLIFEKNIKKVCLYRDPLSVMVSICKQVSYPKRILLRKFQRGLEFVLFPFLPKEHVERLRFLFDYSKLTAIQKILILKWVFPLEDMTSELRSDRENLITYTYNELVKEPQQCLEDILSHLSLSNENIKSMLDEFSHDSQRGTVMAKHNIKNIKPYEKELLKRDIDIIIGSNWNTESTIEDFVMNNMIENVSGFENAEKNFR